MSEKVVATEKGFAKAEFSFWVGRYMDKFYDALENKKIIGNKCPKCGKVFVPPRKICGDCNKEIALDENWVDLPITGTLLNYTITNYKVSDRVARKGKNAQIIGIVRIDGSDTAIIYPLLNIESDVVKIGMKLNVVWEEKLKGHPSDIKGFIMV